MQILWNYVFLYLLLGFLIMIVLKFSMIKLKIAEKKLGFIYLFFAGISFFIFLDLIATSFGRYNAYYRTHFFHYFYLFSMMFVSILFFITSYGIKKEKIYSFVTGFVGCVFFLPILFEVIEDPVFYYEYGFSSQIEWGKALPELIFYIIVSCFMFLNFMNIILKSYQKIKEQKEKR